MKVKDGAQVSCIHELRNAKAEVVCGHCFSSKFSAASLMLDLLSVSKYFTFSRLPPKSAAAAFLKKLFAGLETWKSGAE